MNKTLKIVLITLGVLVIAAVLLGGGFLWGRSIMFRQTLFGPGMMAGYAFDNDQNFYHGPGMMFPDRDFGRSYSHGPGMMYGYDQRTPYGSGAMPGHRWDDDYPCAAYDPGNARGGHWDAGCEGHNGHWEHGPGMMGSAYPPYWSDELEDVEPLTLEEAHEVLEGFIADLGDENLEVGEIMIFSNHAYAQIIEKDSGLGAMEVLVDPRTGRVSLEFGPSMMWNSPTK